MGRKRGRRYQSITATSDEGVIWRARKTLRRKIKWPREYRRARKQDLRE